MDQGEGAHASTMTTSAHTSLGNDDVKTNSSNCTHLPSPGMLHRLLIVVAVGLISSDCKIF